MPIGELAAGLVRVANQLVQMLGADAASEHDAIAGQLRWFLSLAAPKLGVSAAQLAAAEALPVRAAEFFQHPAGGGWEGSACKCFLRLTVGGVDAGRVVVELDTERTPKTACVWCLSSLLVGVGVPSWPAVAGVVGVGLGRRSFPVSLHRCC